MVFPLCEITESVATLSTWSPEAVCDVCPNGSADVIKEKQWCSHVTVVLGSSWARHGCVCLNLTWNVILLRTWGNSEESFPRFILPTGNTAKNAVNKKQLMYKCQWQKKVGQNKTGDRLAYSHHKSLKHLRKERGVWKATDRTVTNYWNYGFIELQFCTLCIQQSRLHFCNWYFHQSIGVFKNRMQKQSTQRRTKRNIHSWMTKKGSNQCSL